MSPGTLQAIAAPLRNYGAVVFEGYEEPYTELMVLVWGSRFDREHARRLLDRRPGYVPQVVQAVERAADEFDGLAESERQRLRQLILRQHQRRRQHE